jgi:hypothetical protein
MTTETEVISSVNISDGRAIEALDCFIRYFKSRNGSWFTNRNAFMNTFRNTIELKLAGQMSFLQMLILTSSYKELMDE